VKPWLSLVIGTVLRLDFIVPGRILFFFEIISRGSPECRHHSVRVFFDYVGASRQFFYNVNFRPPPFFCFHCPNEGAFWRDYPSFFFSFLCHFLSGLWFRK